MKKHDDLTIDYIRNFLKIQTVNELAVFLNLKPSELEYFLYYASDDTKYKTFSIKKRNGGERIISAPMEKLKEIQQMLQIIFQHLYKGKPSVHGFVLDKSIVTNAKLHVGKRILINIDLKNFFPTINFGRVRGIFMGYPFNFDDGVATALGKICCMNGLLPQGAPTSPVLSNFICRNLDNSMMKLAKVSRVLYTRYADDISISTNLKVIPSEIGCIDSDKLILSEQFREKIRVNGFFINELKVRYAYRSGRQEVTGLIVNKRVNVYRSYIRQVKSMLHAWEKYGLYKAANEHFERFSTKTYSPSNLEVAFVKMLTGKINHIGKVRGRDDEIYIKLRQRITAKAPQVSLAIIERQIKTSTLPVVLTEGKSDVKHLRAALKNLKASGLFSDLHLNFHEYSEDTKMSNGDLKKFCEAYSNGPAREIMTICVFDRDVKKITAEVTAMDKTFKNWGNRVFSLVLPVPAHREFSEICIEQYYSDKEIMTSDQYHRRLFLSSEFNKDTGRHNKSGLFLRKKEIAQARSPRIVDDGVLDSNKINFALSKNSFADYVLNEEPGFDQFDFSSFCVLFEHIRDIIRTVHLEIEAKQMVNIT